MKYATTKIKVVKSYPTYQLHAETVSKKVSAEDVFKICILEAYRWIRSRLESFENIPKQLDMPLPEEYEKLKLEELYSFSIDTGFTIDVVYVRSKKIWSFSITEPDMGANIGTAKERQPVFGRSFCTDISFRLKENNVEVGIRTICSEPVDSTVNCEVFRPALIKSLANNQLVGLKEFFALNGQAVDVSTKSNAERLLMYIEDYKDSLPVVLVCSAGTKVVNASKEKGTAHSAMINSQKILESISNSNAADTIFPAAGLNSSVQKMELKVDLSGVKTDIKNPFRIESEAAASPTKTALVKKAEEAETVALENIDYASVARHSLGYAHVCFISGQCIDYIGKKIADGLQEGDIAVICGGEVMRKYSYSSYCRKMSEFQDELHQTIISLPKGRIIDYGKIHFHTDARLLEIEEKRSETLSYEGKFSLLSVENEELRQKIKELKQLNTGRDASSEELRLAIKKARLLEEENERLQLANNNISENLEMITVAYKASSGIIGFYKYKAEAAARFPDNKDNVCDWVEKELSDYITISPNVRAEMKKYSGEMDVATLCDGILFLHGYAKYRKGEIDSNTLELYAESGKWQVEGCGAETLKVFRNDYYAVVNGEKYLMDMHIKYGVKPKLLIRIYFCWDESTRRIIIGHMPTHLATVKQST